MPLNQLLGFAKRKDVFVVVVERCERQLAVVDTASLIRLVESRLDAKSHPFTFTQRSSRPLQCCRLPE